MKVNSNRKFLFKLKINGKNVYNMIIWRMVKMYNATKL